MRLEITPEPSDSERRAIEAAVFACVRQADSQRPKWWALGVEENLDDGASDQAALDGEPPAFP